MSHAAAQIRIKDLRLRTYIGGSEEETHNLQDVAPNEYPSEAVKPHALRFADAVSFRLAKHKI
ncbi:D-erythro-7,8-dihydroneopterin triphosphate epimerase [Marinomonas gallaica]|uniref:D-erythro-7,8-dihydroneopterin triphosphate epimerase n=1 Tax=Marinomonas gallaica TaxID=1806667 RepID=A0A1C3JW01_9GAMM|nr:hypothetical protein [Marinomonas gallaica]SBT19411.1 D-erythro-7,8-dihydroneopterin triphosphate epimerase [Marinomonas gallaica]SBT22913.1 D-erythro-7,8-dihydroneopterin triphosphate epimerase [Marinomonas gallaica]